MTSLGRGRGQRAEGREQRVVSRGLKIESAECRQQAEGRLDRRREETEDMQLVPVYYRGGDDARYMREWRRGLIRRQKADDRKQSDSDTNMEMLHKTDASRVCTSLTALTAAAITYGAAAVWVMITTAARWESGACLDLTRIRTAHGYTSLTAHRGELEIPGCRFGRAWRGPATPAVTSPPLSSS
jgi:hypothetical protein